MSHLSTTTTHFGHSSRRGLRPASRSSAQPRGAAAVPRRSLVCGLVALAAGCGPPRVSLTEGPREYLPSDYEYVRARWTRTEQLIAVSELDDLLTVTSTYESWDFRWAYVMRYAHDYRLS